LRASESWEWDGVSVSGGGGDGGRCGGGIGSGGCVGGVAVVAGRGDGETERPGDGADYSRKEVNGSGTRCDEPEGRRKDLPAYTLSDEPGGASSSKEHERNRDRFSLFDNFTVLPTSHTASLLFNSNGLSPVHLCVTQADLRAHDKNHSR
jgi:hypothetical protein